MAVAVIVLVTRSGYALRIELLTGKSLDGLQVTRVSLAEDEGGRGVVLGRVGNGVGLAGNDTAGRELVDLKSEGSSDEGCTGDDSLEETHVDGRVGFG